MENGERKLIFVFNTIRYILIIILSVTWVGGIDVCVIVGGWGAEGGAAAGAPLDDEIVAVELT
jgi:hypothetical protein